MLRTRWTLAAAAALTLLVATADARPPTGKCRSARGVVLVSNSKVVVYELGRPDRSPGNDAISGRLIACLRATGNKVQLSGSTFGEYWYDRPARAIRVRGTTVAYAVVLDESFGSNFTTLVTFRDMRRPPAPAAVSATGLIGSLDFAIDPAAPGRELVARRAAAWIECPDLDDVSNADPRPNCTRPGRSINSVFAVARGSRKPVRLARARTIDPLSVGVRDGRVQWVQGGRRRSAPLPTS